MIRAALIALVFAALAVAAAVTYQAVAAAREYSALLAQGDAALAEDQTFGAIEAYSGAIALRPDSMLAHLRRGQSYQQRGELEAAIRDFRSAARFDPAATRPLDELGRVFYQLQRYRRAADAYEASLKLDDRSARTAYELALARYREGNVDGALGALNQSVRLDNKQPRTYYMIGICLRDTGRLVEAEQAFETAVLLAPTLIPAREELAELYGNDGRLTDELEQLQIVARLDHEHIERQVAVALAQAREDRADLAVRTLGQVLAQTPGAPLAYAALGRVWLEAAQARRDRVDLGKAIEALQRACSEAGATSEMLTLYGRALILAGRFEAAEQALAEASTRYPIQTPALELYAEAAERLGHLAAARRALVQYDALLGDEGDVEGRALHVATLSTRLGDPLRAARWRTRAAAAGAGAAGTGATFANGPHIP